MHACDPPVPEMNRHHYALYVHNCRLVFLLRRDFTQVDAFRPAEFHWKLEQVRSVCALVECRHSYIHIVRIVMIEALCCN